MTHLGPDPLPYGLGVHPWFPRTPATRTRIEWPELGLGLSVTMPEFESDGGAARHFCLVYRPPQGPAFCFEPITQPIDAFHLPQTPGLRVLGTGEAFSLKIQWRVQALPARPEGDPRSGGLVDLHRLGLQEDAAGAGRAL